MKKLMIGSMMSSMLSFSVVANAEDSLSVYCDTAFSEYQHTVRVDDVVGVAQHRQGFLQIEEQSDDGELKRALLGQLTLGNPSGCQTWIRGEARYGLLARIHFGFDQSELTPMGRDALTQLANMLNTHDSLVTIDGHTDSIGTTHYNEALGFERAVTTSEGLMVDGVNVNRLVVRSFGETKPIASNATEAGRAKNRRSEIWASER